MGRGHRPGLRSFLWHLAMGSMAASGLWSPVPFAVVWHMRRAAWQGPSTGHPERLCPEVPLSPTERALGKELKRMASRSSARPS